MLMRLAVALALLIATPAMAADLSGAWTLRAGEQAIFRFELRRSAQGWTGTWVRPAHFESDGDVFTRVAGPVVQRQTLSARQLGEDVELTFDDPRPGAIPDVFDIHQIDATHAEARYVGARMEPLPLIRESVAKPLGGWDFARAYTIMVVVRPTNAEMTSIFEADQKARENVQQIDWKIVGEMDRQRRLRTQALLDSGALQSADDYYHAAFVFQHGGLPQDYLKAHILSTISAARGKPAAIWIAAATLDRYLQSIGQPQVMGTQFQTREGKTTQQPYDRELISDALRQAMRVPVIAEQDVQRQSYERSDAAGKP